MQNLNQQYIEMLAESGLTTAQLAERLEISTGLRIDAGAATIGAWENKGLPPYVETLAALCEICGAELSIHPKH